MSASSDADQRRPEKFEGQSISHGAVIIAASTIGSHLLGLFRDRLLAARFFTSTEADYPPEVGATRSLDTYYAAFVLPDTIYFILVFGALTAAFIPVFSSYLARGRREAAFEVASSFLTLILIGVVILALVAFLAAPFFVSLIAPGFSEAKQEVTTSLLRLLLASPLIFAVSTIAGGILNSFKQFTPYAIAPLVYNLGIIGGILAFSKHGVIAPASGAIIGALLHAAVQVSAAWRLGFHWRPRLDLSHPGLRRMLRLLGPRLAALAVGQANLWVQTIIASTLATGSIAILNLSRNLALFPVSLIGASVAVATFPYLAEAAAVGDTARFKTHLTGSLRVILYLALPVTVAVVLLRAQIVRLILGAGYFSWTDTRLTAAFLGILALSLFAQALLPLYVRSFFALEDSWTPFKVAIVAVIANIALAFALTREGILAPLASLLRLEDGFDIRAVGLPIAASLAQVLAIVLAGSLLARKRGEALDGELVSWLSRVLAATSGTAVVIQGAKVLVGTLLPPETGLAVLLQLLAALGGGGLFYWLATRAFGVRESERVWGVIAERLRLR